MLGGTAERRESTERRSGGRDYQSRKAGRRMTYLDECRLKIFYWKYAMKKNVESFAAALKKANEEAESHARDPAPCMKKFCMQYHPHLPVLEERKKDSHG